MQTLDFCWLSDIMKGIENIWEEEKVKTKKVLAGITAAAIAAQHGNWLWGWCENRDSGKHRSRDNGGRREGDNGGRDGTGYGKE